MSEEKQLPTIEERRMSLAEREAQSADEKRFGLIQRKASALASSSVVPSAYQNNVANCMIAVEMAARTGSSEIAIMQNMNIIHGKPSFSSAFIIGALEQSKRFSVINYRMTGEQGNMNRGCIAYATSKETGEVLESPEVTMAMAKAEGWVDKSGSKWKTMPELMLRYRAAAFFGRLYAPDVMLGMHSADEVTDISASAPPSQPTSTATDINSDLGLDDTIAESEGLAGGDKLADAPDAPEVIEGELMPDIPPWDDDPEPEDDEPDAGLEL